MLDRVMLGLAVVRVAGRGDVARLDFPVQGYDAVEQGRAARPRVA